MSFVLGLLCVLYGGLGTALAVTESDCLDCHSDPDLYAEKDGVTYSLYVDQDSLSATVHAGVSCVSCHPAAKVEEDEHPFPLPPVQCGQCHRHTSKVFSKSLHGRAVAQNDPLAPRCYTCHGKHNILPVSDKNSPAYVLNVPNTCSKCHREGSAMVTSLADVDPYAIQENYSMAIHADGVYRKGLTVTAVCTSCHTAHNVLPATSSASTISRANVVKTCMKCHVNVAVAHAKIVRADLWEKEPLKAPACVECHSPHKTRRVLYDENMSDFVCMKCHEKTGLKKKGADGVEKSLFVDAKDFVYSVHRKRHVACVKCHVNMDHNNKPVCKDSGPVDCSICHIDQEKLYQASTHGVLLARGDDNAPGCSDCHGSHNIQAKKDFSSPIYAGNIPYLCAKCHRAGERVPERREYDRYEGVEPYEMGIHGKELLAPGFADATSCISCHLAHSMLPSVDPDSDVNPANLIKTCAKCHQSIVEEFEASVHSSKVCNTSNKLPICNDCHSPHSGKRMDKALFRDRIVRECGACHAEKTEAYFETSHGKVAILSDGKKGVKCSDCHGAHDVLPLYYSKSKLHRSNVIETCKQCHPDSNRNFTGFIIHADHNDREKYPHLYYTFQGMRWLLILTFVFFLVHTVLWIYRALDERFGISG